MTWQGRSETGRVGSLLKVHLEASRFFFRDTKRRLGGEEEEIFILCQCDNMSGEFILMSHFSPSKFLFIFGHIKMMNFS